MKAVGMVHGVLSAKAPIVKNLPCGMEIMDQFPRDPRDADNPDGYHTFTLTGDRTLLLGEAHELINTLRQVPGVELIRIDLGVTYIEWTFRRRPAGVS